MKGLIIYKGKYGATRQYAIWLGAALDCAVEPAGSEMKEQLLAAEYIILGSSVYIGKLQLRNWIYRHRELLAGKQLFLFLVSGTKPEETARLTGYIKASIPEDIYKRCRCYFFPGKLEFSKLSWSDKLLLKIGARLSKGSKDEISVTDYNDVKREHITPLVDALKHETDLLKQ
ncbi:flavodoxin domain-containing protein [Chitinophaga japonensis]|uniref:Menaquinone-dependent protoporphyrinogen IX oxidase n=1 Tax=Chitinophaga japonensis TaxID=104662 RepID=A0A562SSK2_CHIJA|nr:flavodoxin domain-containing protein [Chitinophaga japonensis]TWI84113.1 menaquinone-dependent protoporphyrinogen IX oxidase [Chitinophaga japonensis]